MPRPILETEAQIDYLRDGDGAPATGNGPSKDTARFTDKRIQYNLAGAWDVTIEGTVDGTNWVTIQANIVAGTGIIEVAPFWRYMRAVSNVVGTDVQYSVHLGGLDVSAWE